MKRASESNYSTNGIAVALQRSEWKLKLKQIYINAIKQRIMNSHRAIISHRTMKSDFGDVVSRKRQKKIE